jgi:DNA-binding MarR family transcriptional regulator
MTSAEGDFLSTTAYAVFRLNGRFSDAGDRMSRPVGLTNAWWQVLGAVLPAPLTVSAAAREIGITRQSVQRIADLLVAKGLAAYETNPAHRSARLLRPTAEGIAAVRRITPTHTRLAAALAEALGPDELEETLRLLERLDAAMESATESALEL